MYHTVLQWILLLLSGFALLIPYYFVKTMVVRDGDKRRRDTFTNAKSWQNLVVYVEYIASPIRLLYSARRSHRWGLQEAWVPTALPELLVYVYDVRTAAAQIYHGVA